MNVSGKSQPGEVVATLSNLKVHGGNILPEFASTDSVYTVRVPEDVESITMTPTAVHHGATIAVQGSAVGSDTASQTIALGVGETVVVNVVVTAQDLVTTKTYAVTVSRQPSSECSLAALQIGSEILEPAFSGSQLVYSVSAGETVASVALTATTKDVGASIADVNGVAVTSGVPSSAFALATGASMKLEIVVTAHDGIHKKTYSVAVSRAPSTDATLSNLVSDVGSLSPSFSSGTLGYTGSVANGVTSAILTPTTTHSGASVTVEGYSVASGAAADSAGLTEAATTTLSVVVTPQAGTPTKTYTYAVARAPSTDAELTSLEVSDTHITFSASTMTYTATVSNSVASVTVTPTSSHSGASVKVQGSGVVSGQASGGISIGEGASVAVSVEVTAQDTSTKKTYTVTVTRQPSSDCSLSGLVVGSETLAPTFASSTYSYTAATANSVASVTLTATTANSGATIGAVNGVSITSGVASSALVLTEGGIVTLAVVVTAQDGVSKKTYSVAVSRAPSTDATLSNLVSDVGSLSPSFSSGTLGYTGSVANGVTSAILTPTTTHSGASVTVEGYSVASGAAADSAGLTEAATTTLSVVVTPQAGTPTKTYTYAVARAPSTDAELTSLEVSDTHITFSASTMTYTATVSNSVASVTVTPTSSHSGASVKVQGSGVVSGQASGGISIGEGASVAVSVEVTAQDTSTKKTYTVTVTRQPSSDCSLSGLVVGSETLAPTFASSTYSYTAATANSVASVTLTATTANSGATIGAVNGVSITSGVASSAFAVAEGAHLTLTVVVTAQDGVSTKTYSVDVDRAPSTDASLSSLVSNLGALTPPFSSGTLDYTASVAYTVSSVTVTPTVTHSLAIVAVDGHRVISGSTTHAIPLVSGTANPIPVVVVPQAGSPAQTYTYSITRAASPLVSMVNMWINAAYAALHPAFNSSVHEYHSAVPYDVSTATVGFLTGCT